MHKSERNLALADFLRKRRGRLSPSEVGLPPGSRRRTPGLRREEVAEATAGEIVARAGDKPEGIGDPGAAGETGGSLTIRQSRLT